MCGVVGAAGKLGGNEEKMFRRLLELDTIRGPHSTGILFVSNFGNADIIKKVGTPWELWGLKSIEDKFRLTHKVLLGHNRWATQGKINNTNAHPFELGHIYGAHNGTLRSCFNLQDHAKFEVDSENLYHHMSIHGVEDTVKKLNGAFTLTWWDKNEKTLNFVRNEERPLHFCFSEDNKTIFWASESWMLSVSAFQTGIKVGRVNELPVGYHYSFNMPDATMANFPEVNNPAINKLELYVAPVYPRSGYQSPIRNVPVVSNQSKVVDTQKRVERQSNAASFTEYQKRMLKTVEFEVWGALETHGQKYIQCYAVDDDRISVRCYASPDGPVWKKMLASTATFKGMVKSFTSNGGMHLTVDLRSVEEVQLGKPDADDTPNLFVGYQNSILTEEEFLEQTEKGCAWCSSAANIEDAEDIVWIGHKDHVCGDCKEFEQVQEYIEQGQINQMTGNK